MKIIYEESSELTRTDWEKLLERSANRTPNPCVKEVKQTKLHKGHWAIDDSRRY